MKCFKQPCDMILHHYSKCTTPFTASQIDFTKCSSSNKIARAFFLSTDQTLRSNLKNGGAIHLMAFTLKIDSDITEINEKTDIYRNRLFDLDNLNKFISQHPTQAFRIIGGIDYRTYYAVLDSSCLK